MRLTAQDPKTMTFGDLIAAYREASMDYGKEPNAATGRRLDDLGITMADRLRHLDMHAIDTLNGGN